MIGCYLCNTHTRVYDDIVTAKMFWTEMSLYF